MTGDMAETSLAATEIFKAYSAFSESVAAAATTASRSDALNSTSVYPSTLKTVFATASATNIPT